ncbi:hypothetical protein UCDDS831_g09353 [Diplodia seriata]|uniref:Uncharacterized protein n=1 Tax=Diplodia seriata TaxID=420778 RepID=A0A0G2DS14_9PEZI|nr:hypothetical protein UCDDS831_g09353 [Diplodia seriata]
MDNNNNNSRRSSAASTAFRGAFHRPTKKTAVPPILALPTELSQKILRHTITDSDIARDPTNPLELVAQYHKLRLVCWKWAGEMEHVMERWKARRAALLDAGLEDEVVAYSRKSEIWWTMREMWRNGELTQEEVDVVERRIAVAKMRAIRRGRRRRAKREEKERQKRVKKEQRKKLFRLWKRGVKLTVRDAERVGVLLAEGVEPTHVFFDEDADDEMNQDQPVAGPWEGDAGYEEADPVHWAEVNE